MLESSKFYKELKKKLYYYYYFLRAKRFAETGEDKMDRYRGEKTGHPWEGGGN